MEANRSLVLLWTPELVSQFSIWNSSLKDTAYFFRTSIGDQDVIKVNLMPLTKVFFFSFAQFGFSSIYGSYIDTTRNLLWVVGSDGNEVDLSAHDNQYRIVGLSMLLFPSILHSIPHFNSIPVWSHGLTHVDPFLLLWKWRVSMESQVLIFLISQHKRVIL